MPYTNSMSVYQMKVLKLLDEIPYGDCSMVVEGDLGKHYDVVIKDLPIPAHERYNRWEVEFELNLPLMLDDGEVLYAKHKIRKSITFGSKMARFISDELWMNDDEEEPE